MPATYCIGDCETGGLDDRINPILSLALILADEQFNEIDGFASKIKPPPNTWLEVPVREQQIPEFGFGKRNVDHYLEVHTGVKSPTEPMTGWMLNAAAVEKNGFIQFHPDGGWDMESMNQWLSESVALEQAEEIFVRWMVKHCTQPPIGVAHNAIFDTKFVSRHMPTLFSYFAFIDWDVRKSKQNTELSSGWFCTCIALKKWNKASPAPGENAKLGSLAKLAGYQPTTAHEALADARSCLVGLRWLKTGKTFSTNGVGCS